MIYDEFGNPVFEEGTAYLEGEIRGTIMDAQLGPNYKGDSGRGFETVEYYWLATTEQTGVTRETEGWTSEMQTADSSKPYLWQYQRIGWSAEPYESFVEPILISRWNTNALPPGGLPGQILTKDTDVDYAASWVSPAGITVENPTMYKATLLNGWKAEGNYYSVDGVSYFKDSLGFVHCYGGVIEGVENTYVFQFPSGYRPKEQYPLLVHHITTGIQSAHIDTDGHLVGPFTRGSFAMVFYAGF